MQIDYFRADGTLLACDHRRVPGEDDQPFILCDTKGEPLGGWRGIWEFFRVWLDTLPRDPIAWLIVDSKTAANHLVDYHRDDVVKTHLVHGSHLEPGSDRPMGALRPSRQFVLEQLDQWDGVVFLTQQQLDDFDALMGPGPTGTSSPTDATFPSIRRTSSARSSTV